MNDISWHSSHASLCPVHFYRTALKCCSWLAMAVICHQNWASLVVYWLATSFADCQIPSHFLPDSALWWFLVALWLSHHPTPGWSSILHRSVLVRVCVCVCLSVHSSISHLPPHSLTQRKWMGGYKDRDGCEVRGFDTMKDMMATDFELVEAVDMPLLIRETVRLHQWTVAHATVWRRKTST